MAHPAEWTSEIQIEKDLLMDRPIIFSGAMVRALLEGRKTMTRRLLRPQPFADSAGVWCWKGFCWRDGPIRFFADGGAALGYAPGDRLYVRENGWERPERSEKMMRDGADTWAKFYFDADGEDFEWLREHKFKRRPSIHMPRWASRITLTVEAVKVERLQDISQQDAKAEGMLEWAYTDVDGDPRLDGKAYMCMGYHWEHQKSEWDGFSSAKGAFEALWQSLNVKRAPWDSNPWVVASTFKVHKCNIERMAA